MADGAGAGGIEMMEKDNVMPARSTVVLRGAVVGMLVWLMYAAVEDLFCSAGTASTNPFWVFASWHWRLVGDLALTYAIGGAVLGALLGLAAAGRTRREAGLFLRNSACLTLIGAFLIQAIFVEAASLAWPDLETCAAAMALGTALALSLGGKSWSEKIGRHIYPWMVALALAGGPWVRTVLLRMLLFAGVAAAILISKRIAARGWGSPSLIRQAAAVAAMLAAAVGASLYYDNDVVLGGLANVKPGAADAPNIVLITMDTVRADHLPLYGYSRNTAPNLSAFAAHATVYKHAVAVSNMTLATHASLFTGLYPSAHGAHYDPPRNPAGRPLGSNFPVVAAMLARRGYATMAVVANHGYLNPYYGLDRGFDVYDARQPVPVLHSAARLHLRNGVRKFLGWFMYTAEFDILTRRAEEINETAFKLIGQAKQRQAPLFLFLNYMDAHGPYVPPAPYDRMFPGRLSDFSERRYERMQREVMQLKRPITPREREHLISQYDGGIAYLDSRLGRLFARLKERGLYDDAMIVVTSDHGEEFGDRNSLDHGISVYHDEVNVPLIIKYPRQSEGRAVDEMVSQIDVAPTLLEAAKVPKPASFLGQSLNQPIAPGRYLYSEAFPPDLSARWDPRFRRTQRAVYEDFEKFIESSTGERELYDLRADPEERSDAYREKAQLAASMQLTLEQWLSHQPKFTHGTATPEQVLQQLKSLGYVQ
jgi:arylsulfatase A-like enzyme